MIKMKSNKSALYFVSCDSQQSLRKYLRRIYEIELNNWFFFSIFLQNCRNCHFLRSVRNSPLTGDVLEITFKVAQSDVVWQFMKQLMHLAGEKVSK